MGVTEEQIRAAMEQYGDMRHHIELLKSNKQTTMDKILEKYPDAKREIEEADEELQIQLDDFEKKEKFFKKMLQDMLDQYSKDAVIKDKLELKTPLLKVSLTKKVTYDSAALDGMAVENTKLLAFRSEEITSRITLNKM